MSENTPIVEKNELVALTAEIVSAFVANNSVSPGQIPEVIQSVHEALAALGGEPHVEPEALVPAVPIKKSVTPDALICLEDGKKLKMLKRHLRTSYDMSPEEYRLKWDLASDYPMVAPNYAAQRSELAKSIGLGTKGAPRGRKPSKKKQVDS